MGTNEINFRQVSIMNNNDITILIKPGSSSCNCVCSYCFYDDVSDCRNVKSFGRMNEYTRDNIIKNTLSTEGCKNITFAFQGGEPTIVGLEFFEKFVLKVDEINKNHTIKYSIQTNGISINESWCEFFETNNFLVGISIDGYEENHNKHRFFHKTGSFDKVIASYLMLRQYNIEVNVLTVLTKNLAKEPQKLFNFYKEFKIRNIQIIECLPDFGLSVYESPFACTPEIYSTFYSELFVLWLNELMNGEFYSFSIFDDCIRIINGEKAITCGRSGGCNPQTVLESNGDVFPCDFFAMEEYNVGNLATHEFEEIFIEQNYEKFNTDPNEIKAPCQNCPFFKKQCNGGCKRMRDTFINDDQCSYQRLLSMFYLYQYYINKNLMNVREKI